MVNIFLDQLAGEVLDEYAQQTPGIAKQLRVNNAPSACVGLDESVERLAIGPSQVWGGGEVLTGSESASSVGCRERSKEARSEAVEKAAKGNKEHSEMGEQVAEKKRKKRGKQRKLVDRRRRRQRQRRPDWEMTPLSSEEEEDEDSDHSDPSQGSGLLSSSTISDSSTEEEDEEEESMDRIDSLSETSLSDREEEGGRQMANKEIDPKASTCSELEGGGDVTRKEGERKEGRVGGKRQIVLAANFGIQAATPAGRRVNKEQKSIAEGPTATPTADDRLFQVSSQQQVFFSAVFLHLYTP